MEVVYNARKRSHSSKACMTCRLRHVKCNGDTPCGRCIKYEIDCIYEPQQRKRGPKKVETQELMEKINYLEDQVGILRVESSKQQQLQMTLPEKYAITNVSSTTADYMSFYRGFMSFSEVDDLTLDYDIIFQSDSSPFSRAFIYCILANTAKKLGNTNHAFEFQHHAVSLVKDSYFSVTHPHLASTYFLLSNYYGNTGELEKRQLYEMSAINMCKSLIARGDCSPSLLATYSLQLIRKLARNNDPKHLELLGQLIQKGDFSSRQFASYIQGSISFWNKYVQNFHEYSLEEILVAIDECCVHIPIQFPFAFQEIVSSRWLAVKAFLYYLTGKHDLALHFAKESVKSVQESLHESLFFALANAMSLYSLAISYHIFLSLNEPELAQKSLETILAMAGDSPIGKEIIDSIQGQNSSSDMWYIKQVGLFPKVLRATKQQEQIGWDEVPKLTFLDK